MTTQEKAKTYEALHVAGQELRDGASRAIQRAEASDNPHLVAACQIAAGITMAVGIAVTALTAAARKID
jgi:hypothetical protein